MTEEYCTKHEMLLSGCAECRGYADERKPLKQAPEMQAGPLMLANFDGYCPLDHHHYEAGIRIGRTSRGRWVCEEAYNELPTLITGE